MTVTLRPLVAADLDTVFGWESDPHAVALAAFTRSEPADRVAFDAHYRRILDDPGVRNRAIELDGVLVGSIAAFTMEGDREVSYWIDRAAWGRGIATAALRLLLAEEPVRPLFARVAEVNPGSRRVLEKAGFAVVGEETSYAPGLGRTVREWILRLDE